MNLRELFSKYPLGCASFSGEWLRRWEAVGRLLELYADLRFWDHERECVAATGPLAGVVIYALERCKWTDRRRWSIVLMDGTVIMAQLKSKPMGPRIREGLVKSFKTKVRHS